MYNIIFMKYIFGAAVLFLLFSASASDRLAYNNCMLQTKSDYITKKGAAHVSAQCKIFILEKAMVK